MATIDLGKIKFNWRGTYAGGTAYVPDDVVYYMDGSVGSSYMCVANTTGNAPSSGGTPHASWEYLAGQATSPTTTQGDVIVRGAADADCNWFSKSGTKGKWFSNGLTYGTGGGIFQVIQSSTIATGSLNLTTRGTLYDIPHLNVTITPASTSSKFLINAQVFVTDGESHAHSICIKRAISGGATTIIAGDRTTSRDGVFTQ